MQSLEADLLRERVPVAERAGELAART